MYSIYHFLSPLAWGNPFHSALKNNSKVWSIHGSLAFTFTPGIHLGSPLEINDKAEAKADSHLF